MLCCHTAPQLNSEPSSKQNHYCSSSDHLVWSVTSVIAVWRKCPPCGQVIIVPAVAVVGTDAPVLVDHEVKPCGRRSLPLCRAYMRTYLRHFTITQWQTSGRNFAMLFSFIGAAWRGSAADCLFHHSVIIPLSLSVLSDFLSVFVTTQWMASRITINHQFTAPSSHNLKLTFSLISSSRKPFTWRKLKLTFLCNLQHDLLPGKPRF